MSLLLTIFGEGRDLDSLQMAAHAVVVFASALVCIRIAGLTCLISPDRFNLEERPWLLQLNNTAA
ncbi:hypothetical protein AB6804_31175, partial [Caballeronia sp. RCC_10]